MAILSHEDGFNQRFPRRIWPNLKLLSLMKSRTKKLNNALEPTAAMPLFMTITDNKQLRPLSSPRLWLSLAVEKLLSNFALAL